MIPLPPQEVLCEIELKNNTGMKNRLIRVWNSGHQVCSYAAGAADMAAGLGHPALAGELEFLAGTAAIKETLSGINDQRATDIGTACIECGRPGARPDLGFDVCPDCAVKAAESIPGGGA